MERKVVPASLDRVWAVVSDTSRYGEWVDAVVEVLDHHGTAEVGKTYSEINKTLGPLTTRSTWTVREIEQMRRRVDTGTGFAPLQDMTNVFEFRACDGGVEMTYAVSYRVGLGPLGGLVHRVTSTSTRRGMRKSLESLSDLLIAEGSIG
ncbi:SRPBCC family protein [Nocardia cyriacigeorgica]|uniref:SRPBCC family protein n=1 Tax=Nocardia cyriacigeorgica TaxID=135487 RepID=UPI0024589454|nr:SRPBCC family protein [Nocardia cyriacigeorgica]